MEPQIIIAIITGGIVSFIFWLYSRKIDADFKKIPLTVVIEKTTTGYSAYCKEHDGLVAVEDNIPALKDQFHEAFLIMLNYQDEICGQYADMYPSDFEITYVE